MIIAILIIVPMQRDINQRRREFEKIYGSKPPVG